MGWKVTIHTHILVHTPKTLISAMHYGRKHRSVLGKWRAIMQSGKNEGKGICDGILHTTWNNNNNFIRIRWHFLRRLFFLCVEINYSAKYSNFTSATFWGLLLLVILLRFELALSSPVLHFTGRFNTIIWRLPCFSPSSFLLVLSFWPFLVDC